MTETFNVYYDESCHLENDHQPAMVLGAVCVRSTNPMRLQHSAVPGQNHDSWYYKMYFDMLKVILGMPSSKCGRTSARTRSEYVFGLKARITWSFLLIARSMSCPGQHIWSNTHIEGENFNKSTKRTGARLSEKAEAVLWGGFVTPSTQGR